MITFQTRIFTLSLTGLLLVILTACVVSPRQQTASPATAEPTDTPAPQQGEEPVTTVTPIKNTPVGFTGDLIQLAWFYNPPINYDLSILAKNFDVYILTKNYNGERETLRSLGVKAPFLKYLAFFEIQDLPCDEQPWLNNVAFKVGDFCAIKNNHPSWFLRDENDQPLCIDGFCMMDPGNSEWLNFWLQRAIETQEQMAWDGIFMDNVEASLGKRLDEDLIPAQYPNNESYQAAVEKALRTFYEGYFRPQGRPLLANIIAIEDWDIWLQYLNYLDGAMIEDFAVDWDTGYKTVDEWEAQMNAISRAQEMDKEVILVAQGMQNNAARQEFSFASYLLVNEGMASFRYTEDWLYDEIWLYDNYKVNLGMPVGLRYEENGVWKRDFTNGMVMVDPLRKISSISIHNQ